MENNDVSFTFWGKEDPKKEIIRRGKKRIMGAVSVPTDKSSRSTKSLLMDEIKSGKIDVGSLIKLQTYQKVNNISESNITVTEFTVEGRKHALSKIRKDVLEKHQKYMRLNPNSYFDEKNSDLIIERLKSIGEFNEAEY